MRVKDVTIKSIPWNAIRLFLFVIALALVPSSSYSNEISGYVSAEGRYFFNEPLYPEQERHSYALVAQPEYYHAFEDGSSVLFVPFGRYDGADEKRTHFDVRELRYLWLTDYFEMRIGIGKVFWGVAEFVHLVDIINQTDLVEDIDGEEKLGQPMVSLTVPTDYGVLELYVLPWFRERTFPGEKGRLRSEPAIDTDETEYESSDKERHVDYAVRYSNTIGNVDFGVYHFRGTGREPTIKVKLNRKFEPVLYPFYEQIDQTGLDLQVVAGSWLLKLESLYRWGQGDKDFYAGVGGVEYSFINVLQSGMDLGLIGEWVYDERGDRATTVFQNDLMTGLRWAVNDVASTEFLIGYIQDMDRSTKAVSLEGSRRFGNN